jgi:hypothetical protein
MDTLDSLRSNSFREMMAHQKGNHAQERNYQRDRESDQYSLQDIEDRFAQSVGWDAISKLHNVRAIEKIGAFSRIGELAPDGWFFMDGKLVPEQNWDAASPRA